MFKDKEREMFLLFLKGILKNGALKKKDILNIKIKSYTKKGNKQWIKKMETAKNSLLVKGSTFAEALKDAGIFNDEDKEKFENAKTEVEGVIAILETKSSNIRTIKYFAELLGMPFAAIAVYYLSFNVIKGFNHDTLGPMDDALEKMGKPSLTYPSLFENIDVFQNAFFGWIILSLVLIGGFYLFKKISPSLFFKTFKFQRNDYFLDILGTLIKNNKIGFNDLKSTSSLQESTPDKIKKQIYSEMYEIYSKGSAKKISELYEDYNFDEDTIEIIASGEDIQGQFWNYSKIAYTTLVESNDTYVKRLDFIVFKTGYYMMMGIFAIPFFQLGMFYMFDVTQQMM